MTNAGFFRGTSAEQDFRFSNKQSKSRREFKFPPLDTTKINIESLKPWILDRIKIVLENDDELMSDAIIEFFSEKEVDGSAISQFISGFADVEKTTTFIQQVWSKFNEVKEEASNARQITNHDEANEHIDDSVDLKQETSAGPSTSIDDSFSLLKPFLKKIDPHSSTRFSNDHEHKARVRAVDDSHERRQKRSIDHRGEPDFNINNVSGRDYEDHRHRVGSSRELKRRSKGGSSHPTEVRSPYQSSSRSPSSSVEKSPIELRKRSRSRSKNSSNHRSKGRSPSSSIERWVNDNSDKSPDYCEKHGARVPGRRSREMSRYDSRERSTRRSPEYSRHRSSHKDSHRHRHRHSHRHRSKDGHKERPSTSHRRDGSSSHDSNHSHRHKHKKSKKHKHSRR